MKRWGYRADERSTTHPVSGPVSDTDATFYNFDGITYGKGAAVIKQLVAAIGMDGFRAGMRTYFRRHAWGNATLADFLAALEAGSGLRLGGWAAGLAGDGLAQHDRGGVDGAGRAARAAPAGPGRAGRPPDAPAARPRGRRSSATRPAGPAESTRSPSSSMGPRRGWTPPRAGVSRSSSSRTTAITPTPRSPSTRSPSPTCPRSSAGSRTRSCASSCGAPSGRWSGTGRSAPRIISPLPAISSPASPASRSPSR